MIIYTSEGTSLQNQRVVWKRKLRTKLHIFQL